MTKVSREIRRERRYLAGAIKSVLGEQQEAQTIHALEMGPLGTMRVLGGAVPEGSIFDRMEGGISIIERRTIQHGHRLARIAIRGCNQPALQLILDPVEANYFLPGMNLRPAAADAQWRERLMAARFSLEASRDAAELFLRELPGLNAFEYRTYRDGCIARSGEQASASQNI